MTRVHEALPRRPDEQVIELLESPGYNRSEFGQSQSGRAPRLLRRRSTTFGRHWQGGRWVRKQIGFSPRARSKNGRTFRYPVEAADYERRQQRIEAIARPVHSRRGGCGGASQVADQGLPEARAV